MVSAVTTFNRGQSDALVQPLLEPSHLQVFCSLVWFRHLVQASTNSVGIVEAVSVQQLAPIHKKIEGYCYFTVCNLPVICSGSLPLATELIVDSSYPALPNQMSCSSDHRPREDGGCGKIEYPITCDI